MFLDTVFQFETLGDFLKWLFIDVYKELWTDDDQDIPYRIVLSIFYAILTMVWIILIVAFAVPVLVIKEAVKSLVDKIRVKKSNPFKA